MHRAVAVALLLSVPSQEAQDAASEKAKLHEELAIAAEGVAEQLIKLKAWDEARAFLEIIRAKSDARAEALDKLLAKTEKQTSGLKWDQKPSDLISTFGRDRALHFLSCAKALRTPDPEAARWIESEGAILDSLLDYVKAYARLNQVRTSHELQASKFDWALSTAASWHAKYLLHNPNDLQEVEGKFAFTSEGSKAGRNSVSNHAESLNELMDALIHAAFHRIFLFHPALERVGLGQAIGERTASAVDIHSGLSKVRTDAVLAIPKHNSKDIPLAGYDDHTRIIETKSMKELGYPITLVFYDTLVRPKLIRAELRTDLKVVRVYISSPDSPALPNRYPTNKNAIVLVPCEPLTPRTTYNVVIDYSVSGVQKKTEWAFTTGR